MITNWLRKRYTPEWLNSKNISDEDFAFFGDLLSLRHNIQENSGGKKMSLVDVAEFYLQLHRSDAPKTRKMSGLIFVSDEEN